MWLLTQRRPLFPQKHLQQQRFFGLPEKILRQVCLRSMVLQTQILWVLRKGEEGRSFSYRNRKEEQNLCQIDSLFRYYPVTNPIRQDKKQIPRKKFSSKKEKFLPQNGRKIHDDFRYLKQHLEKDDKLINQLFLVYKRNFGVFLFFISLDSAVGVYLHELCVHGQ